MKIGMIFLACMLCSANMAHAGSEFDILADRIVTHFYQGTATSQELRDWMQTIEPQHAKYVNEKYGLDVLSTSEKEELYKAVTDAVSERLPRSALSAHCKEVLQNFKSECKYQCAMILLSHVHPGWECEDVSDVTQSPDSQPVKAH